MPVQVFTIYALSLCVFWSWSFTLFSDHFHSIEPTHDRIESFKKENASLRLAALAAQEEVFNYHQQMASLMPGLGKDHYQGEKGYPLRQIASVLPTAKTDLADKLSETLLMRGKTHFKAQNYAGAVRVFQTFIEKYPYSKDVGEAYFLTVESYFRMENREESTRWIQEMVNLFPDNELTGHALIRLGAIFEKESRPEEALKIYQTVLQTFPQRDIASQALESAKRVQF